VVEATVLASIRRYLAAVQAQGIPISFAVLYGSQAAGHTHEWSDIDLVVVSPKFDDGMAWENVRTLWRTTATTDPRIQPIPCGERMWEEDDERTIIEVARREGIRVDAA